MADAQGQTDSNAEYPQDGKTPKHETLKGIRGGDKHQARSASQPSDRPPGRPRFKIRPDSRYVCQKYLGNFDTILYYFVEMLKFSKKIFFSKRTKKKSGKSRIF
jgi:hypothetical protein